MTRQLVLLGLFLSAARPLAAQRGYWLSVSGSPGVGVTLPIGRHLDVEPGIYLQFAHSTTSTDSSRAHSNSVIPGIAAALRWTGDRAAAITPVGAVQVMVGKRISHYTSDYDFGTASLHSEQTLSPMEYTASVHVGAQVRLSNRASLSIEHHLDVVHTRGTLEVSNTYTGSLVPPPTTSRQSYRDTSIRNGLELRVRIYRKTV